MTSNFPCVKKLILSPIVTDDRGDGPVQSRAIEVFTDQGKHTIVFQSLVGESLLIQTQEGKDGRE